MLDNGAQHNFADIDGLEFESWHKRQIFTTQQIRLDMMSVKLVFKSC